MDPRTSLQFNLIFALREPSPHLFELLTLLLSNGKDIVGAIADSIAMSEFMPSTSCVSGLRDLPILSVT
eukprot:4773690-Pyramimonas_sp.AAC.1